MRVLLVTDAWEPQVNGVVRTLQTTVRQLELRGDEVEVVHPGLFRTIPCPTYPEIRLAILARGKLARIADEFDPDAVHIATEGPLGMAARRHCRSRRWPFTTSFHTRFPEYVNLRTKIPLRFGYRFMRWFHGPAKRMFVATDSLIEELRGHGFTNTALWSRGVDTELFRPGVEPALDLPKPVWLSVGRVAVEKNLEAFLELDLPGTKLVVGDGPARKMLAARYPDVVFAGAHHGEALAAHYNSGDVFVFPSRTDTFGLVILEALACGLPVAAYPVQGPLDVLGDAPVGVMNEDLKRACEAARRCSRDACRGYALGFTWAEVAARFGALLAPIQDEPDSAPTTAARATG